MAALTDLLTKCLVAAMPEPEAGKVNLYLLLGVNGVGKTTTAAKLAAFYQRTRPDLPLVLAAADTFRAAAIDQLKIHGERLGARVVAQQQGGDPGAVVFDAASTLQAGGGGLALIDTAGRLHNKEHLVRELQKIDRIAQSKASAGCYKKLLVLDATTGQNALRQSEVFHEAIGVDYVVMTKADSTAKGGVAFSLGLPIAFVCTGESYNDISVFDPAAYTSGYLF
jgi:fused signal recognition particle receptor